MPLLAPLRWFLFSALILLSGTCFAENIVFPADANIADVTKPPYNADPTGKTDSTLALQAAFNSKNSIVYLPNGTYVISDTVNWGDRQNRQILQGQSESGTILKLPDNCPGFEVATTPKAMVWAGKVPAQRFRNGIRNITLHTGKGNAGAIGAQYIANNQGAIHHFSIISGDGAGVIGLDLGYTDEQGPCLIKDVTVKGFDVGISMKHAVDGVVLEGIRVEDQKVAGILNDGQSVSMRDFTSRNAVPALINKKGTSMLALDVSDLQGTGAASEVAAIENDSGLFVRNLTTSGYQLAIDNQAGKTAQVVGPKVAEFVSHPILSLFPSPPRSLNLPVKPTPELPCDDLKDWVNVQNYKPKPVELIRPDGKKVKFDDWTEAVQQAIDSGKSTVYFPKGSKYVITGEVRVRGKVKRLIGMDVDAFYKAGGIPQGTIIFEDGESPVVVFERFDINYSGLKLQHVGKRTLVLSSVLANEIVSLEKCPARAMCFSRMSAWVNTRRAVEIPGRANSTSRASNSSQRSSTTPERSGFSV
jgi:Pectate lyase superfamily protein